MFHFWFNTDMLLQENQPWILKKEDLDGAHKDKKNKSFDEDFSVWVYWEKAGEKKVPPPLPEKRCVFMIAFVFFLCFLWISALDFNCFSLWLELIRRTYESSFRGLANENHGSTFFINLSTSLTRHHHSLNVKKNRRMKPND